MFRNFANYMKTLHVFNPEHDIALAANLGNFTAPRAGRQLRSDLGFLPAFWADDGDAVLVDDVHKASCRFQVLADNIGLHSSGIQWVDAKSVGREHFDFISPWGWDKAICQQLLRYGINEALLPTDQQLEAIHRLSHRRSSAALLPLLHTSWTVGESFECTTLEAVRELQQRFGHIVIKAPWSSSGRGVCFSLNAGWISNTICRQGSVMVEPFYQKVTDFAMEFEADEYGHIRYLGLSLFHAHNGAYAGNLLASESVKRQQLGQLIPVEWLDAACEGVLSHLQLDGYCGPLGIDMMIVAVGNGHYRLHPCVEINLRRTMGHVALSLQSHVANDSHLMQISYDGTYRLSVEPFHAE